MDRVTSLVRQRSRIEVQYLAALGELTSRYGTQAAACQLRDLARMTSAQARSDSKLASDLVEHDMTATLDALAAGEIHTSHARVIAREAPKKHRRSEEDFLELCAAYPADTVARHTLANESQQVYEDLAAEAAANHASPVDAELAMQRHERRVSLWLGDDGMWHLRAKLDFLAGRRLSQQLAAAVRAVAQRDTSADDTHPQRTADALCELIAGTQRPQTSLVIVADYDLVSGWLANPRLDDGTPLSAEMLSEAAANSKILPAMFNGDWTQLALGRARSASEAQRIILAIRDQGCIACATQPENCHAHHILPHAHDGLTDIANLALLCPPCHTDNHKHNWHTTTEPDGRPKIEPPAQQTAPTRKQTPTLARSP